MQRKEEVKNSINDITQELEHLEHMNQTQETSLDRIAEDQDFYLLVSSFSNIFKHINDIDIKVKPISKELLSDKKGYFDTLSSNTMNAEFKIIFHVSRITNHNIEMNEVNNEGEIKAFRKNLIDELKEKDNFIRRLNLV